MFLFPLLSSHPLHTSQHALKLAFKSESPRRANTVSGAGGALDLNLILRSCCKSALLKPKDELEESPGQSRSGPTVAMGAQDGPCPMSIHALQTRSD